MSTEQQPAGPADAPEVVRQALIETSFWRSREALRTLAIVPPVEPLREGLAHGDATVRRRAVRLLARWAAQLPEGRSLLRKALRDPAWPVRRAAVQGLAADPAASPALVEALADPDPGVREGAGHGTRPVPTHEVCGLQQSLPHRGWEARKAWGAFASRAGVW